MYYLFLFYCKFLKRFRLERKQHAADYLVARKSIFAVKTCAMSSQNLFHAWWKRDAKHASTRFYYNS